LPYTDNQYLKDKAGNWRMLFFKLTYGGDEEVKFAVTPKHVVVFEDNDELSIDRERLERDLSEGNFGAGILSNEDYLDPGRLLPPNEDDLRLVSLTEELIFRLPFSAQQP
jgi:hypothetical protein